MTLVPTARFAIEVDDINEPRLVEDLEEQLTRFGFDWQRPASLTDHSHSYRWFTGKPEDGRPTHSVLLLIYPPDPKIRLVFGFNNDHAEPFDESDWRFFFKFRDEIVPKVLPGHQWIMVRHPATFTEDWDLARLAEIAPEPLPEEAQARLEAYQNRPWWKKKLGELFD